VLRSRLIQRGQTCLHFSLKLEQDNTRYTMPQPIQLRRQMLRFARSLPPGPERNGRRQIAASLRSLVRNTKWLAAHTIEAPVKEYRVYTVDTEGHFIKTIKLDCPDDASATESARQFIDGLDIEPLIARSRHSSTSRSRAASVGGAF
jgi:hypothetical protein